MSNVRLKWYRRTRKTRCVFDRWLLRIRREENEKKKYSANIIIIRCYAREIRGWIFFFFWLLFFSFLLRDEIIMFFVIYFDRYVVDRFFAHTHTQRAHRTIWFASNYKIFNRIRPRSRLRFDYLMAYGHKKIGRAAEGLPCSYTRA